MGTRTSEETSASWSVGGQVAGRYTLRARLGEGTFAEVYRAEDLPLAREVVLKALRPEPEAAATLARFQEEAALLADLKHVGIPEFLDFGEAGGRPFLVTSHAPGETLAGRLARGPLPPDVALEVLDATLDVLAAVHPRGIVHRDLKPSNLFLPEAGGVLILDFGLARTGPGGGHLTDTGAFVGTPYYAAPDQLLGELPDPRDDLYSLGVTAFEMLSGTNPFVVEGGFAEVSARHISGPPPRLARAAPGLPRPLCLWVGSLLERHREDRPRDAEAARGDLADRMAAPPASVGAAPAPGRATVPLSPPPRSEAASPGGRRSPALPVAVLLLGVALLGALAGREPPPPLPVTPPPAPAAPRPPGPLGPEPARRLAESLSRSPPLSPDPLRWPAQRARFPVLERWYRWLADGGDPTTLPAGTATALRDLDADFAARSLPRPFYPGLYVPELLPRPLGDALRATGAQLGLADRLAAPTPPWLAEAGRALDAAMAQLELAAERFLQGRRGPTLPLLAVGLDLHAYVREAAVTEASRIELAAELAPARDQVRRYLFSAARAIDEVPPGERGPVAELLIEALGEVTTVLMGCELETEPVELMGLRARHPWLAGLEAACRDLQSRSKYHVMAHPRSPVHRARTEAWRRAAELDPSIPGAARFLDLVAERTLRSLRLDVEADPLPALRAQLEREWSSALWRQGWTCQAVTVLVDRDLGAALTAGERRQLGGLVHEVLSGELTREGRKERLRRKLAKMARVSGITLGP